MKRDVGYYELNVFFTMPLADTEIENELQITITATVSFMDVENGPRWGMTCKNLIFWKVSWSLQASFIDVWDKLQETETVR